MTNFVLAFAGAFALNALLTFRSSDLWKKWFDRALVEKDEASNPPENRKEWWNLLFRYLVVYLLATMADWLQGPYVYALYHAYGYTQHDIAILFIAGFGSSAVFGSFIGGMADWGGRRLFVLVYGLVYTVSCMTKHFKNFYVLLFGRLLGGIATSLLFSIFEAWLIRAHADAGLKSWISKSFTWAAYANSIIAIASGLMANHAADGSTMREIVPEKLYFGGYLEPFDIALVISMACGLAAMQLWEENYGEESHDDSERATSAKWYNGLRSAFTATIRSSEILLCGLVISLFEGSMYIFVFMWTPALMHVSGEEKLPFGLIFSTFMVCSMAGASFFSIGHDYYRLEHLALFVLALASTSMVMLLSSHGRSYKFFAMNLFEFTVGMYFPVMGCLKSAIVPESKRAAIYNLYRIPLNLIVLFGLLTDVSPTQAFAMNLCMLSTATGLQMLLIKCREKNGLTESSDRSFQFDPLTSDESSSEDEVDEEELFKVAIV